MLCCGGTKIPLYYDKEGLLRKLRSIDDLNLDMKLSNFKCQFDQYNGTWNNNFNKDTPIMSAEYEEQIASLKQKLYEKELKCEKLEKLFLAKTVRLLYMAQTHCELKRENEELFEKYGIKTGNLRLDLDKILPNANSSIINNNKNENEKNNNNIDKEKKKDDEEDVKIEEIPA